MILDSIELKNFRQYKYPIEFEFSQPNDKDNKNITLIIAANGVGKTTLLQAFRYCFYGQKSRVLNLPRSNKLINNTLVNDLKELDSDNMYVSVSFSHKGTKYLAIREQKVIKIQGKLQNKEEETFTLSYQTKSAGWKAFEQSEALLKIKSILPDELSQIFMFDGERMERNFADREFGNELRESILGILDIRKYDKLLQIIGAENRKRSVIGLLSDKIEKPTLDDKKRNESYINLLDKRDQFENEISHIDKELEGIESALEKVKLIQGELEANKARVRERNEQDILYESKTKELNLLAQSYLNMSKKAIQYKLLIKVRDDYDNFIQQKEEHKVFYDSLHINTIEDILEKGICLCGRPVKEHSPEEKNLINLKDVSLPISLAQNLSLISQKFKEALEYKELSQELRNMKTSMNILKDDIDQCKEKSRLLNIEIQEVEQQFGSDVHLDFEDLQERQRDFERQKAVLVNNLELIKKAIARGRAANERVEANHAYNNKIIKTIKLLEKIKSSIQEEKNIKDEKAREILQEEFSKTLSNTTQGNYSAFIDQNYKIKIFNNYNQNDETNILSTGENVAVSLSFINALIKTARKLSNIIDENEKYAVIMDAALSSLDEKRIERVGRTNLTTLDQLVFMSFKRQLRDEMYRAIKDNVGKAYLLTRTKEGHVKKHELEINSLDNFIHDYEEEGNV